MAGYRYGPPPPPPQLASSHNPYAGHNSYPSHVSSREAPSGGGGGRGGRYDRGRGDYQAAAPPQVHYDYSAQQYSQHNPPYPASHPPTIAYSHPQSWAPEHGHAPHAHHAQQPHPQPALPAAPNYQANYAPQPYPPGPYSQPSYSPSQQYGHPYQANPQSQPQPPSQPPQHWTHVGPPAQAPFVGGRARGGYHDRSGPKPQRGGHARPGYQHEPQAHAAGNFGQPFPHDPRPQQYPPVQYSFPPPPPPPPVPMKQESHGNHFQRRGRGGGGHRDGGRGRGGHSHSQNRHGGENPRQNTRPNQIPDKVKVEPPSAGRKKKRKTNTLGLTPGNESETEDDEGEEKALVDLIGMETLQITDVKGYLAERRKNYPTKERVEAKKAAELARRDEDKAALLEKQADKLRRQLRRVESSIKRKREQGDEGDEMRDSSESESDDEKPEVMSSRRDDTKKPSSSTAPKADVTRHCKYYSTGGACGKKGKCRFVHDPEAREAAMKEREANDGRMTIQQRLILNDKEQEDLTVLQSIQYLRQKGIMSVVPAAQANPAKAPHLMDVDMEDAKPAAPSLLPARPASLPDPPVKREHAPARRNQGPSTVPAANSVSSTGSEHQQEWLVQPYGSSKGKPSSSDDLP